MIIDEAEIYVRAGNGGNGCLSFRRERFIPRGGPDGGNGGDGGAVNARTDSNIETLLDFNGRHHWIAENGRPGMGRNRAGAHGQDLTLELPVGTLIYDRDTGILLKDLDTPGEQICIAEPGKGGRGNASFATPTHQTPREVEEGTPGQERWLRLELKLIADVGLVGMPNAGKSTLLSRLSHAKPKIADYPFTTLKPQLGIVELSDHRRFVMADLPGLIAGAHQGAGLGDTFLRHIERTRVLLHLVDVGGNDSSLSPIDAYQTVRRELNSFSPTLAQKPELVIATKIELVGRSDSYSGNRDDNGDSDILFKLAKATQNEIIPISAVTGEGLQAMTEKVWAFLSFTRAEEKQGSDDAPVAIRKPPHDPTNQSL